MHQSFLFLSSTGDNQECGQQQQLNDRPIIGILSQEWGKDKKNAKFSYIAASYVKFVESAGARVIPIMIEESEDYYAEIVSKTNGLLFPGGGTSLKDSGYARAGRTLWRLALEKNAQNGCSGPYPLFTICLGFELMSKLGMGILLKKCHADDISLPLDFMMDPLESKMFAGASPQLIKVLKSKNVTYNHHSWCVAVNGKQGATRHTNFTVISENVDTEGMEFVSAIEHSQYPLFGVQFHPEKAPYEFSVESPLKHVPHQQEAIEVAQFLANRFVAYARMNHNNGFDEKGDKGRLIYNYQPSQAKMFQQVYTFPIKGRDNAQCDEGDCKGNDEAGLEWC